jgi:plastocyanin
MKAVSVKRAAAGMVATCAAGALALGATGTASAEDERRGGVTIEMVQEGQQLSFDGPPTVFRGENLTIVNSTDPSQVGPHTFSLTQKSLIPDSGPEFDACHKAEPGSACRKVFRAHEVNFEERKVGKKVVDDGKEGWNLMFREQGFTGDSWFALKQNAEYSNTVSAPAGKTLSYFCAIHPEMQGEIDVVGPQN